MIRYRTIFLSEMLESDLKSQGYEWTLEDYKPKDIGSKKLFKNYSKKENCEYVEIKRYMVYTKLEYYIYLYRINLLYIKIKIVVYLIKKIFLFLYSINSKIRIFKITYYINLNNFEFLIKVFLKILYLYRNFLFNLIIRKYIISIFYIRIKIYKYLYYIIGFFLSTFKTKNLLFLKNVNKLFIKNKVYYLLNIYVMNNIYLYSDFICYFTSYNLSNLFFLKELSINITLLLVEISCILLLFILFFIFYFYNNNYLFNIKSSVKQIWFLGKKYKRINSIINLYTKLFYFFYNLGNVKKIKSFIFFQWGFLIYYMLFGFPNFLYIFIGSISFSKWIVIISLIVYIIFYEWLLWLEKDDNRLYWFKLENYWIIKLKPYFIKNVIKVLIYLTAIFFPKNILLEIKKFLKGVALFSEGVVLL